MNKKVTHPSRRPVRAAAPYVLLVLIVLAAGFAQAASRAPEATAANTPNVPGPVTTVSPVVPSDPVVPWPGRISPVLPPRLPRRVTNVMAEGVFHFPLQVGNQWTYEKRYPNGYETTWQAAVTGYSERSGGTARGFELQGYFGETAAVDYGAGGELVEVAPDGGTLLWYRLGTNDGTKWASGLSNGIGQCNDLGIATLASHHEYVQVPAGEFTDAVRVDYESNCMDAGIVSEWFAADVGLVKRVENSIAGPIESVLLSAVVAGVTLPDHAAAASLTLDHALIVEGKEPAPAKVEGAFRVHEQNTDGEEFLFVGCVSATLTLVRESGKAVFERRIDDGGCCDCKNLIALELHGETLKLPVNFDLVDAEGQALPEGHYSVIVTLDSLDAPPVRPSATTHFHVKEAR